MNVDLNDIGRNSYNELRKSKVILDKDKMELTLTERKEIINTVQKCLLASIKNYDNDIHKYTFMIFFYASILGYVNNTDLNKYISFSLKKDE